LLGDVSLEREADYTVAGSRVTISEAFLVGLSLGSHNLTFVMGRGANPSVTVNVIDSTPANLALPYVWAEPNEIVIAELQENASNNVGITVQTSPADDIVGGLVVADVVISAENGVIPELLTEYTIFADLSGFVQRDQNYHRIAALEDGRIIGGSVNGSGQNMVFSANADTDGTFTIAYVENLRRLILSPGFNNVVDLAGNVPDQIIDSPPVIQDGRTLIPIRLIAEALGAEIDWDNASEDRPMTIYLALNGETLSFPIGEVTPQLAALGMDVPAQIINDRTMVPLRFVSEFFGAVVNWDNVTRNIEIISGNVVMADANAADQNPVTVSLLNDSAAVTREEESDTVFEIKEAEDGRLKIDVRTYMRLVDLGYKNREIFEMLLIAREQQAVLTNA
jgi:hypothetical protein